MKIPTSTNISCSIRLPLQLNPTNWEEKLSSPDKGLIAGKSIKAQQRISLVSRSQRALVSPIQAVRRKSDCQSWGQLMTQNLRQRISVQNVGSLEKMEFLIVPDSSSRLSFLPSYAKISPVLVVANLDITFSPILSADQLCHNWRLRFAVSEKYVIVLGRGVANCCNEIFDPKILKDLVQNPSCCPHENVQLHVSTFQVWSNKL